MLLLVEMEATVNILSIGGHIFPDYHSPGQDTVVGHNSC